MSGGASGGVLMITALVQLALTAIPAVGATLVAVRLGVRSVPVLLGIALAASGVAAMLSFWVYYLSPPLGGYCDYAIVIGSIAAAIWSWPGVVAERDLLRQLAIPLTLWALGSLFVIFFGFLHGGTEVALQTGATRFGTDPTQLASDNFIPSFFADWMFAGHPGTAPIFEPHWLFSDRPPLQVGYILSQRLFGWDLTTLHAQLLGVLVQQLWIVGLWALLVAARVSARVRALAMTAALLSDVAIVNAFFVWPKLLAAAFVLAALALVVSKREDELRAAPATTVLLGVLCGLSFLSHGSSVFGLIPLVIVAWRRGLPSWRWVGAGIAAALVVVLPWSAYQHWGDPPGNRVVKWSLAGVTKIDDRGILDSVVHAYSQAGVGTTLENKLQNFATMAGGGPDTDEKVDEWIHFSSAFRDTGHAITAIGEGRFGHAISEIRESRFSHLLWTFGLLILGLPLILYGRWRGRQRDGPEWDFACFCGLIFVLGSILWGLIVFGNVPARAVVIEGSLALPLVGIAGIVAGLWATYRRWALWLVGLNAVTVLVLYAPTLTPQPGTSFSLFAACAAALSVAGFLLVAFSWAPACVGRWWRNGAPSR
jgi:hypothetical protein